MDMLALSEGLNGFAQLAMRANTLLYGARSELRVEVDEKFERSSLVIPVHLLAESLHSAESLLSGPGFTAIANLLAILGFAGLNAASLFSLFKRFQGRRVRGTEDLSGIEMQYISISVLIGIYNDREIQRYIRRVLDPLHETGVEQFQTRRNRQVIQQVFRDELLVADQVEIEELTGDEEIWLDIEKVALRRNLSWHFSNGETSFDARIEHESFWDDIDAGEQFGGGDRMHVHLRTVAKRLPSGRIQVERTIPQVISVDHAPKRNRLPLGQS